MCGSAVTFVCTSHLCCVFLVSRWLTLAVCERSAGSTSVVGVARKGFGERRTVTLPRETRTITQSVNLHPKQKQQKLINFQVPHVSDSFKQEKKKKQNKTSEKKEREEKKLIPRVSHIWTHEETRFQKKKTKNKHPREEKEKIVLHNSLSSGPPRPSGCNIFFLFRRVSKSGAAVTAEKVEIFECSLFDKSVTVARAFRWQQKVEEKKKFESTHTHTLTCSLLFNKRMQSVVKRERGKEKKSRKKEERCAFHLCAVVIGCSCRGLSCGAYLVWWVCGSVGGARASAIAGM